MALFQKQKPQFENWVPNYSNGGQLAEFFTVTCRVGYKPEHIKFMLEHSEAAKSRNISDQELNKAKESYDDDWDAVDSEPVPLHL